MAKKNNNSSPPPSEASGADLSMLFSISETIKEQIGLKSRVLEIDRTALNISKKITEASQNQNKGLESRDKLEKQISKNKKLQERAALLAKSYTQDLFGTHKKNYDLALRLQKENIKDLATIQQMQDTAEETGKLDKKTLAALKKAITGRDILLNKMDKSIAKNAQIAIQAELAADELNKETLQREKELALLNEIEKKMGFLGKTTKALGELPVIGKAFTDSFAAAEARMKAITEETGKVPSGLEAAKIQLQELEGIAKGALFAAVVKEAFELEKNLNNIQRSTGQTEAQVNGLNYALQGASAASGNFYMTSSDMLETFSEITKQIGRSAEILGTEAIVEATALRDQMGLSAEQAGNFAAQARIGGKSVEGAEQGVFDTVNNFNKLNKTAFNASDILKDVAETSKDIGAQFGFNTAALAEAAVQAAELGLELSDLNSIADKLTDFQSSIQSELEAELLTGQELNLEKARELALTNDLAGLGKELESQGITAAKYSKMNRIQQEATASALGMSTDQMGKMLYSQELNAIGAEKFQEKYGEQTLEATKQVDIQQRLQKALTKIADALSPIVAAFADLVSHAGVLYGLIGLYLFSKIKTIGSFFSGMKDNLKESAAFAKQVYSSIFSKKGAAETAEPGADVEGDVKDKIKEKIGLGDKTDEAAPTETTAAPEPSLGEKLGETGEGAGKGLTALAAGIKSFSEVKFKDIAKVAATAGALLLMTVAVPALIALAAVGPPAGTGLAALGTGLAAFGQAMKALGPMGLAYAAAGLALLVGSLIGIGFALNLAAPAIEAFGNIVIGVLGAVPGIVTAIANGFVTMFSAITSNIGSVLLLGPALLGIAAGLAAMSFAGFGALPIIGALTALGIAGAGLSMLGGMIGGEEAKKPTAEEPSGEMAQVVVLLKELITAVKAEGKVYLNGQAVGKVLALSSYKT